MNQSEAGAVLRPLPAMPAAGGAMSLTNSNTVTSSPRGEAQAPPAQGERAAPAPGGPTPGLVPPPGTRIHQYELIRQLGAGGMGTVFLARDTRLGRRVAIKFLHTKDPQVTRRFILEARATARCSHENIVVIHEVGEFQGSPFMVLEYLQGQPLHKVVGGQRVPPTRAAELMVPVVKALACAHAHGIVHRDLKPDNILVTDAGSLKVLDFGIAKVLQGPGRSAENTFVGRVPVAGAEAAGPAAEGGGEASHITRTGMLLGTLSYMSPEQWRGGEQVDHRTDLWAVGIMLFRLLAGRHPLDPLRGPQLMVTADLSEPMPRLRDVAPDVPAELADVVDRCLAKPKEERWQDALSLLRALEPFLPGRYTRELQLDQSPYAGLSSFQESDASRFFGRSREIAALVGRLRDRPLLAVVGPSGTGKSSFVRAGLMPVLKRSGETWETLVIRPGRQPLEALAHTIAPLVTSSTSLEEDLREHHKLVARLRAEPGIVGSVLRGRARRNRQRILLFVDQFEELYTLVPEAQERLAFTACLSGIADDATSPVRVVASLRSDFLDRVPEDERFMAELGQGLFFLTTPGREGLRDALVQPAEMAGYRFETPEMVEDMLRHLEATPGALPLLQFAATQLWEERDPARRLLTRQRYEAMGGIAGALASHANSVLSGMTPQGYALARAILVRLVTPERTRAIVSLEELCEQSRDTAELQRVMDQLVQARLLVVQTGGGASGGTVELVHESLIQSWPTLRRWLDEGQEDSVFLEQLRNAARQWQAMGRDSGLLWGGEMVEEARRFQRRHAAELPQVQKDFLAAIFAQEARTTRRKRRLVVGAMVFLSLLVAASAVALVVIRKAQREAELRAVEAQVAELRARKSEEDARKSEEDARKSEEAALRAEAQTKRQMKEVEEKEQQRLIAQRMAEEKNEALKRSLLKEKRIQRRLKDATKKARQKEEEAHRKNEELQRLLLLEQKRREKQRIITPHMKELKRGVNQ